MSLLVTAKRIAARFVTVIEFCHECGRRVRPIWTVDDSLWRWGSGKDDGSGVLCIECFDARCRRQGLLLRWTPEPLRGPRVVEIQDEES